MGAVNVLPPSVDVATTCRLGYLVESAFSVQKTSTVPVEATAICPVSRYPWTALLFEELTFTAFDQVTPSSSECATYNFVFPFPEHVLQNTAQLRYTRP